MLGAVSGAWAQLTTNDIDIDVKPSAAAGTVTKVLNSDSREVTLTVTPASGYYIKASDIIVEKLVDPGKANAPRRRISEVTGVITGKLYNSDMTKEISSVKYGSTAKYVFTIPSDYDGVYVTATFRLLTEGDIIRITASTNLGNSPDMTKHYILVEDVSASVVEKFNSATDFTGIFEGEAQADGTFPVITGLTKPLFRIIDGGTVKNIMLKDVSISEAGHVGAIAKTTKGATKIYNCGVFSGSLAGTDTWSCVGGLVGRFTKQTDTAPDVNTTRVINCFSYANVSTTSGQYATAAGVVGYVDKPDGSANTTQDNIATRPMVMNCMFYGDITAGTIKRPVYGGSIISNSEETGINNYNYYRRNRYDKETDTYVDDVSFDNGFTNISNYNRSWPADAKYLTRFEYYRSILNSNKKLCTWWVNGTSGTAPTDEDIEEVGIAKWVLDPSIAPYPILKKWGKYPSVINQDPEKRFDSSSKVWVNRVNASEHWGKDMAPDTVGQKLGTIIVNINAGSYHSGSTSRSIVITAMDTENNDYCYGKIQLPYYNEIFGNPNGSTWEAKYGGNYTAHVVTGWDVSGGSAATDYNFADRNSYKDRVYAQGGYFYVPKGVTSISITAHWADAIYLCNKDYSIDRVNVATGGKKGSGGNVAEYGSAFTPAGTIPTTFQGKTVYTTIKGAIGALGTSGGGKDVYNQAIVLIGNIQLRNHSSVYGATGDNTRPFTLMSADLDFDNEPDNCLELQFRNEVDRPGVQPIRFDFLPVPELGLAIRTNKKAYAIGIMIPLGHFEITETAFMHTTQFEYDAAVTRSGKSPVIINGGEHEMFTKRKQDGTGNNNVGNVDKHDRTSYFLLGGNAWIHRFAPGAHPNTGDNPDIYLFPVNVIGGQVKELYLTGLYRPELPMLTGNKQSTIGGAPRCYIDGGKFDIIAGAGYDKVKSGEDVTFKINHSLIEEFYGGGINGTNPIGGNIDVTINNSRVDKYCGGPKVGKMNGKTVTTHATGTTFGVFYGGGNGGNSYYRQLRRDGDMGSSHIGTWTDEDYDWNVFAPLEKFDDGSEPGKSGKDKKNDNKGYHAEYEFEVFSQSNGLEDQITQRGFINWIQFGITTTGDVSNTLENCKVLNNFYGGGNLATVDGNVTSTLTNTQVEGSVFGAGYSAAIPTFSVHDKTSKVRFPSIDFAGTITDGMIQYKKDGAVIRVYKWTNEIATNAEGATEDAKKEWMKQHPTYQGTDGKWYCYTWNSLENLGTVTGNVSLTIDGNTVADENGKVMSVGKSVYGGGEESGVDGNTEVTITSGAIGSEGNGGVEYGNVYGGGKGKNDNVLAGLVKGNTKVTISNGRIYHNVYGGGAYGSVGDFDYNVTTGIPTGLKTTAAENSGKTEVYITGGTFGWNGKENGMVFGSSRGDVGAPGSIEDQMAWVYSTQVTIGDANAETAPTIKGSVYGGGENGHVFQNAVVNIAKGTIGIAEGETITNNNGTPDDTSDDISYSGAAYPYRGNVYGGGCGTDKYYTNTEGVANPYDGNGDSFNPLAGIVYGNATITMTGGQVVHNIYGAGAMGSVGKTVTTNNVKTTTGGTTTININGGQVGVDGTHGDGNVFGAARGDVDAISSEYALVRKETSVSVTGGTVKGNVYGGGELGCVGVYDISSDYRTFTWKNTVGTNNTATNSDDKNTGICNVTINGSSAVVNGNVFGAGKGKDDTFWCEKGIAYSTDVNIQNGTVAKNVYGGGEVGRVETDTKVKIGDGAGTANGTAAPAITGSVFGGGAGVETHGYSALTRGNTTVTVEGNASVGHSVYGGGEIASVGKYGLDTDNMPSILQGGGYCYVTVKGYATIEADVFGAGEGVKSHFDSTNSDVTKRSRRMTLKSDWTTREGADRFAWDYLPDETEYAKYLETLALATQPEVTIDGNASISGSVFGGGELGLTKGSVIVNINGGTITEDVYGGGSLANTNTTSTVAKKDANGNLIYVNEVLQTEEVHPTTTVNLKGGTVNRNVYGGGLGQLAQDAVTGVKYSEEEAAAYNTAHNLNEGDEGYKTTADWKVEHQDAVTAIEAKVYGNILVELNKPTNANDDTTYGDCEVKRNIFGCNNLNGSPQKGVEVHIYKTVKKDESGTVVEKAKGSYEVEAVYGGGNMAAYEPVDALSTDEETKASAHTNVIIDGCGLTSILQVYGGGNAASTPATNVTVNGTYEIDEVFGGGNGKDKITINGVLKDNPGANVGFKDYSAVESTYPTKADRQQTAFTDAYVYGTGKASVNIYGGTVHRVFGGSNTKGNVRQTAVTMLEDASDCDFCVDEAYGGGKSAPMDAEAKLLMACIPGLSAAYGGAEAADIQGNVTLNITNGTFDRVFGGNNKSGTISGSITVNIEEVGCKPIIIGELYGGGNLAGYSVKGYDSDKQPKETGTDLYAHPQVNVKSFTSIGTIYGGGYGSSAVMVGNPTVNVSVAEGDWKDYVGESSRYEEEGYTYNATGYKGETLTITDDNGTHDVVVPSHDKGKIGAINNVFGGGNAAKVIGDTHVNIGTLPKVTVRSYVEKAVTVGAPVKDLYTRSGEGTVSSPYKYTETGASDVAVEGKTYYEEKEVEKDVIGVDIRGNVYGGGNNAEVTGNTNVQIGKENTTTNTTTTP